MPKLLYIANQRMPTEKAHGLQIAKMCEAFAGLGLEVELLAPTRHSVLKETLFEYYSVNNNFKFKRVFTPDFYLPGKLDFIAFLVKNFISALTLFFYAMREKADIIFSRDELPLYFLSFFRKNLVFEAHKYSKSKSIFYKRFNGLGLKTIVISDGLKNAFLKFGFNEKNLLTSADSVDLEEFDIDITKEEARKRVGLPLDKKIILYSGQFFSWKGVDVLMEASDNFKNELFVFVGGISGDPNVFKGKFGGRENILMLGQKPHKKIPYFLKAADALVLPNKKDGQISEFYTSPLKLFEYMASGRPIVASDLPSIREILNERNAIIVEPNNARTLADGIKKAIHDTDFSEKIAIKALEDVKNFTWAKRTEKIIGFIS